MNIHPQYPQLKVKLDWRNYYFRFSELHGGTPIIYKGRQLFQDGWGYSLEDYAGPEYPPPEDAKELRKLQIIYWYTRWNRAKNELNFVQSRASDLKNLQSAKSAPLQHVVVGEDEEGKKTRHVADYDPRMFDHVIKILQSDVDEADKHLQALKEKKNDDDNQA